MDEAPRRYRRTATRRFRRAAGMMALAAAPLLVLVLSALKELTSGSEAMKVLIGWVVIASWPALVLLGASGGRRRPRALGRVRLDGDALVVSDETSGKVVARVAPGDAVSGNYRPGSGSRSSPAVEISLQNGDHLDLEVRSHAEATRILDAIHLDADSRRAVFTSASGASTRLGMIVMVLAVLLGVAALPWISQLPKGFLRGMLLFVPGLAGFVAARLTPQASVTVGTDAIVIGEGRRAKLCRLDDIEHAWVVRDVLAITRRDGQRITVTLGSNAEAALARIAEARSARETGAEAIALDLLGPSFEEVRSRIRGALRSSYRGSSFDVERLLEAMSDPAAALSRRVAAAWALSNCEDDEPRARARIAVEQLAEPRARILLDKALADRIAEDDLAAIEEETSRTAKVHRQRSPAD